MDKNLSRNSPNDRVMPLLLAKRRIAAYLASKFQYGAAPTSEVGRQFPEGRAPATILLVFLNMGQWRRCFLRGNAFDESESSVDSDNMAWLRDMPEPLRKIIAGLNVIYDGTADAILLQVLKTDQRAAAETLLSRPELVSSDIFDVEAVQELYS